MSLLGQKLKDLRGESSLYEVGKELGVAPIIISRFETDERRPNLVMLKKLSEYYDIEFEELSFLFFEDLYQDDSERQAVLTWAKQVFEREKHS